LKEFRSLAERRSVKFCEQVLLAIHYQRPESGDLFAHAHNPSWIFSGQ